MDKVAFLQWKTRVNVVNTEYHNNHRIYDTDQSVMRIKGKGTHLGKYFFNYRAHKGGDVHSGRGNPVCRVPKRYWYTSGG